MRTSPLLEVCTGSARTFMQILDCASEATAGTVSNMFPHLFLSWRYHARYTSYSKETAHLQAPSMHITCCDTKVLITGLIRQNDIARATYVHRRLISKSVTNRRVRTIPSYQATHVGGNVIHTHSIALNQPKNSVSLNHSYRSVHHWPRRRSAYGGISSRLIACIFSARSSNVYVQSKTIGDAIALCDFRDRYV